MAGPVSASHKPTNAWYCPSRWLMAHHDPLADISTWSSHLCLADLNGDGENLLALIDFKPRSLSEAGGNRPLRGQQQQQLLLLQQPQLKFHHQAPYSCRLRVYRGQQLIYNHFLDDIPCCLLATSAQAPPSGSPGQRRESRSRSPAPQVSPPIITGSTSSRTLLALAINDDVYFYHKLRPSLKLSLEDHDQIVDTLNKSELDAWQMVRQNKVDVETMRELLVGLSTELGAQELTSHSRNFLALNTPDERKNYLLMWKFKRLNNGLGEHLMSMDTICCAAARLKYTSNITRSGDFGQTRDTSLHSDYSQGSFNPLAPLGARWNKILDVQKDGLVLGTEDRHLLIYELRPQLRTHLEAHHRLPSVPDHILVERPSPASFESKTNNLKGLTYKILISCRNCRIYSLNQSYLAQGLEKKLPEVEQVSELVALKCNVLDMCWAGDERSSDAITTLARGAGEPNFVVACLDRRVYCFSSDQGQCKWVVESELPITCILSLPTLCIGTNQDHSSLIGVASTAARIDFYLGLSGRIVDSIYLNNDYCQAMTFGRFGREDNCLCLTTGRGHLLIFILKRAAKFANAQCLSSAASHAAEILSSSTGIRHQSLSNQPPRDAQSQQQQADLEASRKRLNLNEPPGLPSAFALTKVATLNPAEQALEALQHSADHNCSDQVLAKSTLDAHLVKSQLQIPAKSRDFVDQIVEQSRHSTAMSKALARHMIKLKDKIKATMEQESDLRLNALGSDQGNRVTLARSIGLGNTYRVSLSLRLDLRRYSGAGSHLLSGPVHLGGQEQPKGALNKSLTGLDLLSVLLFTKPKQQQQRQCQVKPFRFELRTEPVRELEQRQWILERTIEFRLTLGADETAAGRQTGASDEQEPISLEVHVLLRSELAPVVYGGENNSTPPDHHRRRDLVARPVFISSVNIPTC